MTGPPPKKKRRDPLLDAADALEQGRLTHDYLRNLWSPDALAEAHQQDIELGPWAAAGLGAARGASFGLSDLAQALGLTKQEKAAVAATATEHPHLTTTGTLAGAALPFLLTGGAAGPVEAGILGGTRATLPGLSALATRTALGAAQGAGLTPGNVTNRAIGAVAGAAGARYAPAIARGTGAVAGRLPLIGGLFRNLPFGLGAKAAAVPEVLTPRAGIVMHTAGDALSDIAQASADRAAGRISAADYDAAMDFARQSMQHPQGLMSPTALTPMPGAPQGLLGPEGISPTPKASYPPTISEMQGYNLGKPGHPIWQGEGSPTTSAEVRGGEPLLPSANPAVAQALQRAPFAKLQAALRLPETPTPIKDLILAELSRRGIVGPGLLAPR